MPTEPSVSLRQLDEALGLAKGSAFRAFKALRPQLREGVDYRRLDAVADAAEIEGLRRAGVIYASTVHAVLLSPAAAGLLKAQLRPR